MLSRARSVEDTLTEIAPIRRKIGVARISNITYLDKLYIPNYSAVLPNTEDLIWVYSGKGSKDSHAKASALMETIERYSSLPSTSLRSYVRGSFSELSKSYRKVLHPNEVVEAVNPEYDDKDMLDFVLGFDVLSNQDVLVPAEIALYGYRPQKPAKSAFSHFHTNGLASGNVIEEAVCHALCEVIERDAVSIADLCVSTIPYNIIERVFSKLESNVYYNTARNRTELTFVDDPSMFPEVEISELLQDFGPIKDLIRQFARANLPILVKHITQEDIGIPTFVASCVEWLNQDYGFFANGYGTHPDARIALLRAITEVSQTRAANIQGARDDLKTIRYNQNDEIYKRKWQFMPSKSATSGKESAIRFSEINTYLNEDILDDIKIVLRRLKKAGLKRAIIVDLTNPDIRIPVVRAIIPGLETFELTKSVMGDRARECFERFYRS